MQSNRGLRTAVAMAAKAFVGSGIILGLSGCGTEKSPVVVSVPAVSPLNGNWWITGDLPAIPANLQTEKFGLAATIDVVEDTIYASGSSFYPCTNSGDGGGLGMAPADLGSDGTFTLQAATGTIQPTVQVNITGKAPAAAGQSWTGSFSATNSNAGCSPVAGSFTATPIASFSGTFQGTGSMAPAGTSLEPIDPSLEKQVTFTVNLTQGGSSSLDAQQLVRIVNSVNALTATISVTGLPCFTSGTTGTNRSGLGGNTFALDFTMDDGSTLHLVGYATEPAVASVTIGIATVRGGTCDNWAGIGKTTLTRK